MRFEWDEKKNRENQKKHGVSFEIAVEVFADPFTVTILDQVFEGEERFWTIGRLERFLIVLVVHTTRDEDGEQVMRIISARKTTPQERKLYEETE